MAKCSKYTGPAKLRCEKLAFKYAGAVANMGQDAFDNARKNCSQCKKQERLINDFLGYIYFCRRCCNRISQYGIQITNSRLAVVQCGEHLAIPDLRNDPAWPHGQVLTDRHCDHVPIGLINFWYRNITVTEEEKRFLRRTEMTFKWECCLKRERRQIYFVFLSASGSKLSISKNGVRLNFFDLPLIQYNKSQIPHWKRNFRCPGNPDTPSRVFRNMSSSAVTIGRQPFMQMAITTFT